MKIHKGEFMEAKKVVEACSECGENLEIDFATAQFAVQIARIQGETKESRTFYASCPNCQTLNMVESTNKADWGNRKAPSPKKLFYSVAFGCAFTFLAVALIFYFAGRGIVTVFEWLFN